MHDWSWLSYRRLFQLPIARRLLPAVALIGVYSFVIHVLFHRLELQQFDWGAEGSVITGLVLSFLVAFRNNAAYDRWWEGRKLWGQLTNDVRNLCLKVRAYVKTTPADRQELGRCLTGFVHALRLHLRGGVRLQELPGFHNDSAQPAHVPGYLAGLVHRLLARWTETEQLHVYQVVLLDAHARGLLDVCGACERIRSTPLATSYRGLLRHGILVYLAIAPFYAVEELGLLCIPVICLVAYFVLGVEFIAEDIEDPFGTAGDDLPLETYCERLEGFVRESLGDGAAG